ncbi:aspartate kinase [Brevibacillus laterosporus]|uniref:aspartate kinase n=1 Tax=Brevibacillus laterosporus TaxID=1465 RepID=UPI0018CDAC72|nr:aspartate kinase [Brevibacillus laterosporus]MBG9787604.1 aspartate kinase [Brevibacillus laterosporus]
MKVCKFGGTSLANAEQIRKVCQIILNDETRRLIVVSAPGKRYKEDVKVTDLLITFGTKQIEHGQAQEEWQAVVDRYQEICSELQLPPTCIGAIISDLQKLLQWDGTDSEGFMDVVKASGEDNCARVVAEYLRTLGAPATYINPRDAGLLVSGEYGNAQVLPEAYEKLALLKEKEGLLIFPGFFGYTQEGKLTTFSRGGSDVTGSILAAAVRAELYENFTDVDSVYAVNPNLVSNPCKIKEITYREMRELSYAGFSVFHEEALIPAFRAEIPVCIKNTNNPTAPGTKIVTRRDNSSRIVAGIASDVGFCRIYVSKYLMNKEIGFGRKLLQILEEEHLSYEHSPSGIDDITVILRQHQLTKEKEARIVSRIKNELHVDDVHVQYNMALVMLVGEGMRSSVGISARAATALAIADINIEMINQGSSEVNLMFGVRAGDADHAVIALYQEFYKEEELSLGIC